MPGRGGWIWAMPLGRGDSISLPRPPAQRVVKHDVGLRACVRKRRWHIDRRSYDEHLRAPWRAHDARRAYEFTVFMFLLSRGGAGERRVVVTGE